VRISSALISSVTGLKATGEDIKSDLADKYMILKTIQELGVPKGSARNGYRQIEELSICANYSTPCYKVE
ncbi:hypothetical protein KI387_017830, partial [Taxus chinensis]